VRILGLERDNTACNQLRIFQPLLKLQELGLAETMTLKDYEVHTEEATQRMMEADIVLFQRPSDKNWFDFIKICQKNGKFIVIDYDDDPFNTHPMNPFYQYSGIKEYSYKWENGQVDWLWKDGENGFSIDRNIEWQDMFKACLRKADMVTCTTDILKETFSKYNNNVKVLPNLVDLKIFRRYNLVKNEVRIGFQGGYSHYPDVWMIKDAILEVVNKYQNVKFVFMGDFRHAEMWQGIPTSKFEFHQWSQYNTFPYVLPLLNLDIGLAPLVNNTFNWNKSNLKWHDYTMGGAATIASNIPPYSNTMKDGEDCILVTSEKKEEWVEAISRLIENEQMRKDMNEKSYQRILNEYDADKNAHLWVDAYKELFNQGI
jgi:glycosyltransferase involved in cell wall biosynthesis